MNPKVKKIALYGGLVAVSWLIVGVGVARQNSREVNDFKAVVHNDENNHFLSWEDVHKIAEDIQGNPIRETPFGEIKIAEIEQGLLENPYVRKAEVFKELSRDVIVELELRRPLARVIYEDGSGFYLDQDFQKIDLSHKYSANVVLVRGVEWEPLLPRDTILSQEVKEMQKFLKHIGEDDFLRSQISEVVRDDLGELTLYSEVGDLVIKFGKPVRITEKFDNMKLFLDKVLNQVGWDKYREISVKYRGQVIAR